MVATTSYRAVFWDFGGVILTSPFEAFNRYEEANGLPRDFIRSVNAVNPDSNAWARIERQELTPDEFDVVFAEESESFGHRVSGRDVLALLGGDVRPEMVVALDRVNDAGYVTACLTNNVASDDSRPDVAAVMDRFHHIVESSRVGVRKPELSFYTHACEVAGVEPADVVFLDDLGINLKPAKAMGMATIKVVSAAQAIDELAAVLDLDVR